MVERSGSARARGPGPRSARRRRGGRGERELTRTFSALGDPTRRAVLMDLAAAGEATVSELASRFPISLAAVSKHLKVLEEAGLIQRQVRGRQHFCRLRPAALAVASGWVEQCQRFWESRLDKLEELLGAAPPEESNQARNEPRGQEDRTDE